MEEEAGRPQEPQRDGRRTRRSAPLRPRLRSRSAAARTSADELAAAAEAEAASEAARLADEGSGARAAEAVDAAGGAGGGAPPASGASETAAPPGIARNPETPPPSETAARTRRNLTVLDDGRSPNPSTCPFFRSLGADGTLGLPVEAPDASNRCAAFGEPQEQSLRQQAEVCLTEAHGTCARYLRGTLVAREQVAPTVRPRRTLTPATLAATLVLIVSAGISFGYMVANGGLTLPTTGAADPTASAVASPTPEGPATAMPPIQTPPPTPRATPTPTPTSAPTPTPTSAPTPTPEPTPSPTPPPTPTPRPTSDRYQLLKPCPDRPDCWIYTVRSGDNIYSIARYFGVPQDTVYDLNPWLRTRGLRAGQQLILPPPTR